MLGIVLFHAIEQRVGIIEFQAAIVEAAGRFAYTSFHKYHFHLAQIEVVVVEVVPFVAALQNLGEQLESISGAFAALIEQLESAEISIDGAVVDFGLHIHVAEQFVASHLAVLAMQSLGFVLQLHSQAECLLGVALAEIARTLKVHYVEIARIYFRSEFHLIGLISPYEHAIHIVDIIIVATKLRNGHCTIFIVAIALVASKFVKFHQVVALLGIAEIHIGEVLECLEAQEIVVRFVVQLYQALHLLFIIYFQTRSRGYRCHRGRYSHSTPHGDDSCHCHHSQCL